MGNRMNAKTIVLFMPDSPVQTRIEQALIRNEFHVIHSNHINRAIEVMKSRHPDAVIVDWDFANGGFAKLNPIIRQSCQKTALVLLSKTDSLEKRLQALDEGADECLGQPPAIDELVAKVKALMRKIDMVDNTPKTMRIKDIEINLDTQEVARNGRSIELTYTQFKILCLLASHREAIFTREEILQKVWGSHAFVTDRTVDVHVKRLREKLGDKRQATPYIQTIHGLGYRFV
jgi:DNA-binding response OmpR family regulator